MADYITDLDVSINKTDEDALIAKRYVKIPVDLNTGAGGNRIYLWYTKESGKKSITQLQVTFNDEMAVGLTKAGYKKIPKDLNEGIKGHQIYLWHISRETKYDTPIVDIAVTTDTASESQRFSSGWERLTCDLNRKAGGNWIHVWVKRKDPTYICDVTATQSYGSDAKLFQDGYIRVDENTNRDAAEGASSSVFIWYRQTTDPQRALKDLGISTNYSEVKILVKQNYKPANVDLNEGTSGEAVFFWYKQEGNKPIKAITVLLNKEAWVPYVEAGAKVIERNLNMGNKGSTEYLCFYQ